MNEEEKNLNETCSEAAADVPFTWERGNFIENEINEFYGG
jgi:hypothetical protein